MTKHYRVVIDIQTQFGLSKLQGFLKAALQQAKPISAIVQFVGLSPKTTMYLGKAEQDQKRATALAKKTAKKSGLKKSGAQPSAPTAAAFVALPKAKRPTGPALASAAGVTHAELLEQKHRQVVRQQSGPVVPGSAAGSPRVQERARAAELYAEPDRFNLPFPPPDEDEEDEDEDEDDEAEAEGAGAEGSDD